MTEVSFWQSAFLWREAMIAACIAAALLSYLGLYVVMTRNAFVTAVTTNAAALGVELVLVFAPALAESAAPLAGGITAACLGVGLLGLSHSRGKIPGDAVLAGAVVATSAATLLIGRFLGAEYHHVQAILFGDAVVASRLELIALGSVGALTLIAQFLWRERFVLVSFDPENARIHGMNAGAWRLVLALNIGLALAVCVKSLGALTTFALTVIPALAALALNLSLRASAWASMALAVASAALGYYLSFVWDLPVGPTITAVAGVGLIAAALTPRRS